jgi:hypothetical protein
MLHGGRGEGLLLVADGHLIFHGIAYFYLTDIDSFF